MKHYILFLFIFLMSLMVNSTAMASDSTVCYYDGKTYSDGSVIDTASGTLRCDQGTWVME